MTREQMHRRLRALRSDERGFTLMETVFAITIMFGLLVALASVVTTSLGYQTLARQRQTATGIANEVMEQVRGLAYNRVTAGHLDTDISPATDPNLKSCDGGATIRFLSCTQGSVPGSGEPIVRSAGLTPIVPLVPHRSSTSPNTDRTVNGITYSWATYVTRADPVTRTDGTKEVQPYRITVIVSWTGGRISGDFVRAQSILWAPEGCRSPDVHPFPAPCQPFFFGEVTVPQGTIDVEGTVEGATVDAEIDLVGASASVQHEQLARSIATFDTSGVVVTDTTTRTLGGAFGSLTGDNDPGTPSGTYARSRCWAEVACLGGTLRSPEIGGTSWLELWTDKTPDAYGTVTSATDGAKVCFPWDTVQSDRLPCAGARLYQSDAWARLNLTGTFIGGTAQLARVYKSDSSTRAWVDRQIYPASMTLSPPSFARQCNPTADTSGCLWMYGRRRIPGIELASLPGSVSSPSGWDGAFLYVESYADDVTAAVGSGAPTPVAPAPSGTIWIYDQDIGDYRSFTMSDVALNGLAESMTLVKTIEGREVTLKISTVSTGMAAARRSVNPTTGGTLTSSVAQVTAPTIQLSYTISIPGQTIAQLTLSLNLGTLQANADYAPAPLEGT